MSCGLVFVLSNDPLSRLVVSITKQEYSTVGYYYTFGKQIYVSVPDPFGMPLYEVETLNSLLACPYVVRVSIRPIKEEYEKSFRLSLTKVSKEPLSSLKEGIYWLFGFPSSSSTGYTALSRLEEVLKRAGISLSQYPINTLFGSGYEWCVASPRKEKGIEARIQVLSYLAAFLNQQTCPEITTNGKKLPAQIQSYILDDKYFLPLQNLTLIGKKDFTLLTEIYERQLPRLRKGISKFLSMLGEPGFLFLIARGARNSKLSLLEECLKDVLDKQTSFLQEVKSLLPKSKLRPLLQDLEIERRKASSLLGEQIKEIEEEKSPGAIEDFRFLLKNVIEKGEDLDLRSLITIYNSLSDEEFKCPPKKIQGRYYLSEEEVGIVLKSGDRLNLPLHNPRLSSLDYETLVEILTSLETLADNKNYDGLRTSIAEEIASYSTEY